MAKDTKQLKKEVKEAVEVLTKDDPVTLSPDAIEKIVDIAVDDQLAKAGVVEVGKDSEGKAILQSSFTNGVRDGFDYVNDLPWSYVIPDSKNNPWVDKAKEKGQLITTKVLSDKEIAQLELPYVIINGVQVEPVMTSLETHKDRYWDFGGREAQQFYQVPDNKGQYSLFKVIVEGRKVSLLLDKKSKFVVQDESIENAFQFGRFDYRGPSDHNLPSSATLHNSSAFNCMFLGHSILENVDLKDSVSNQCKFVARRLNQGYTYHSGYLYDSQLDEVIQKKKALEPVEFTERTRHIYEGIRARLSSFTDSKVSAGHYYRSGIQRSTIEGNKWVRLSEAHVTGSRVCGSSVTIEKGTVLDCSFNAETNIHHGAFNSRNETLHTTSIYMPNKFSLARIPMPDQDLTFIRASETEFELFMFSNGPRINVNADREQIESAVADVVRQGEWRDINPGVSVLTNSIEKYVTDTIVSRLNVVNTLDGVIRMAADLKRDYGDGEDIYATV